MNEMNLNSKKPQFGSRILSNEEDVFLHNTWDKFEWDDTMISEADARIEANSAVLLSEEDVDKCASTVANHWNKFYENHEAKFFKDRHWLLTECPELSACLSSEESTNDIRILEVACGVGNAIFPLLEEDLHHRLQIFACDISAKAIDLLTSNCLFPAVKSRLLPFVCDMSCNSAVNAAFETAGIRENSLDFVTLIFALSAMPPSDHSGVIKRLVPYLKPGGIVFFRDYCRYDLAQLRFKLGQCIGENNYVRRDGTLSYFFRMEEAEQLFKEAGLSKRQLVMDSRLIVNRKRRLRMYRMWLQGLFCKDIV